MSPSSRAPDPLPEQLSPSSLHAPLPLPEDCAAEARDILVDGSSLPQLSPARTSLAWLPLRPPGALSAGGERVRLRALVAVTQCLGPLQPSPLPGLTTQARSPEPGTVVPQESATSQREEGPGSRAPLPQGPQRRRQRQCCRFSSLISSHPLAPASSTLVLPSLHEDSGA
ncbi:hypothetical protein H920_02830 [Fukomys damarensis]|uniref:Uncharacterized protein n=1 Tax=Fukomys damarensis TaxID=885580 RepID=A0A091DXH3_FUKDA|nr:hypothetical protein H920_02830 [Fukomys damarensis]